MIEPTPEELEFQRDLAALEAMFLWQLADRERRAGASGAKWAKRGDEAAARAYKFNDHLEKARRP